MSAPESKPPIPRSLKWRYAWLCAAILVCGLNVLLLAIPPGGDGLNVAMLTGSLIVAVVETLRIKSVRKHNETTPEESKPWRTVVFDYTAFAAVALLAAGWTFIPGESWWALASLIPALILADSAVDRIRHYRRRSDAYRAALIAVIREYDRSDAYNRADSLDYVPAEVLYEAREPVAE